MQQAILVQLEQQVPLATPARKVHKVFKVIQEQQAIQAQLELQEPLAIPARKVYKV